jgi:dolichyl-phosphate beta-glucosyltransferase
MSNQIRTLLSLIVPAYNEADRLPDTIRRIQKHSFSWNFPIEVIVVVEPSEDRTLELAENAAGSWTDLRVLTHHEKRGKGFAVRSGMQVARGDLIFFTDADLSTPLEDLNAALALFAHDRSIDLIVGNRMHPESQILQRQNASRECMGKVFNRIVQTLTGLRIRDTLRFYSWLERWVWQLLSYRSTGQIRRLRTSTLYATVRKCFLMLSVSARWLNVRCMSFPTGSWPLARCSRR